MVTTPPKRKEDVKDPIGRIGWPKEKGRDGERTPMQWNAGVDAGFSTAKSTWLPVAPDYKTVNVATEEHQPTSLLNYYKILIRLRKTNPQLRDGDLICVDENNDNVLSYIRKTSDGRAVLVALNFTASPQTIRLDLQSQGVKGTRVKTLLASFSRAGGARDLSNLELPPYGSFVGQVQQ
jgi:alpha-glucosidase